MKLEPNEVGDDNTIVGSVTIPENLKLSPTAKVVGISWYRPIPVNYLLTIVLFTYGRSFGRFAAFMGAPPGFEGIVVVGGVKVGGGVVAVVLVFIVVVVLAYADKFLMILEEVDVFAETLTLRIVFIFDVMLIF